MRYAGILRKILQQLWLRADAAQTQEMIRIDTSPAQTGNILEVNSVNIGNVIGGDRLKITPLGHILLGDPYYPATDTGVISIYTDPKIMNPGYAAMRVFMGAQALQAGGDLGPIIGDWVGYYCQVCADSTRTNVWGMNPVVANSAVTPATMFGIESDVSNYNAAVPDPFNTNQSFCFYAGSGGDHMVSAAYAMLANSAAASFRHGMWIAWCGNGQANTTLITADSTCNVSFGFDLAAATMPGGWCRTPNNCPLQARNAANTADKYIIGLAGNDSLFLGYDNAVNCSFAAGGPQTTYFTTWNMVLGVVSAAPAYGLDLYGGDLRLRSLATPATPATATATTGGTLAAATYVYWVVVEDRMGFRTVASVTGANQVTTGATSTVTITPVAVTGANKYYVLRKATAPTPGAAETILVGSNTTGAAIIDTGAALTSYTSVGRNNTADATVDGAVIAGTGYTNAVVNYSQSLCYVATANAATTTTAETKSLVGTGLGSMTSPAQSLAVGQTYELEAEGFMTTGATAGTITFQMKIGSVVIATTGAIAPTISITSRPWRFKQRFTVRAVGSGTSANVFAQGKGFEYEPVTPSTATTASTTWQTVNTAVSSGFDSTIANLIDFQSITSNALHTITCTNLTLKRAA